MSARAVVVSIAIVVAVSACLRMIALDRYPAPINQDELSNIYDGWSLAETGADRHGAPIPFVLRGFGDCDYRPALYAWLYAPIAKLTGFSIYGGRFVSALLGTISIALAAWWAYRTIGIAGALLSATLVSVTPWHLSYSRMAHEGSMLPIFFCILIILSIRLAVDRTRPDVCARSAWFIAGGIIGFSANAYGATRLTALAFCVLAFAMMLFAARRTGVSARQQLALAIFLMTGAFLGALPQTIAMLLEPRAFFARAGSAIMQPTGSLHAATWFFSNLGHALDPRFLFLDFGKVNNLSVARLLLCSAPFSVIGLAVLLWPRSRWSWEDRALLLGSALICLLPAALSRDELNALRISGCAIVFPLIAIIGASQIYLWLQNAGRRRLAGACIALILIAMTIEGVINIVRYVRSPRLILAGQQNDLFRMAQWLAANDKDFDRVWIEPTGNQPDLYVAAFTGMTPREFQLTERFINTNGTWDLCARLGRYSFGSRHDAVRAWESTARHERWLLINTDLSLHVELKE